MSSTKSIRYGDMLRTQCLGSMLNYTRYAFKHKTGNKFIVGDHHTQICNALDAVVRGEIKRLIINIAPRYSKTELAVKNFIAYGFAINPKSKFIHLSYSDDLVLDSSREIKETLTSDYYPVISDARYSSGPNKKWYTVQGGGMYAVSAAGQVTGFGAGMVDVETEQDKIDFDEFVPACHSLFAGAIIIDDPIKPEDALSETVRERVNNRFETTIRNRVNSRDTPIIVIMQRLHEHDLCGYLIETEPDDWTVLSLPCITFDAEGCETALWPFKHTVDELRKIEAANSYVFDTQYMQNPTPIEGLMYHEFKTYEIIPYSSKVKKKNYTDTADMGSDFLCSICYDELPEGNYITDVLYTQKPMEYTEPKTAEMLAKNDTAEVNIESNNGGRGFARNVEKQLREMKNNTCWVRPFTQADNKQVRIFSISAEVNNITFFPADWQRRWPEFAKAILSYRKEGGNTHDDAEDALTGTIEKRDVIDTHTYTKEDLGIF